MLCDARNVGKRTETVAGFSILKNNGEADLSPKDIYTLIILFGDEDLLKGVIEKYFKENLVSVFGQEFLTRAFVSFDWKALKNLLNFEGNCIWCSQSMTCSAKTHGNENKNCKCDKNFSKIGSCQHQVILKSKLGGMDRWRVLLDVLHGTLRTTEHLISTFVFYALQIGNSLEEINNWINKNVFKGTGGVVVKISEKLKDLNDIVTLNFNSISVNFGSENDRLKLVYHMPQFLDHFFKKKLDNNFFVNSPINDSFYKIMMAKRIELFHSSIAKHKRRYLLRVEEIESSKSFAKIVEKYRNQLIDELNGEKSQEEKFLNISKIYSTHLLLVLMLCRNGIPRKKKTDDSDNQDQIENKTIEQQSQNEDNEETESYDMSDENAVSESMNIKENQEIVDEGKEEISDIADKIDVLDLEFEEKYETIKGLMGIRNDEGDEIEDQEKKGKKRSKKLSKKVEINNKAEQIWSDIASEDLLYEEALDLFDLLIQDFTLVAQYVPTKLRGYYGIVFFRH